MSEMIDREATVKQICKMGEMLGGHDRDVVIAIALFVQDDKTAFPTVEPKQGEWIIDEFTVKEEDDNVTWYHCSECFAMEKMDGSKWIPYCWHCGADMRPKEGEAE